MDAEDPLDWLRDGAIDLLAGDHGRARRPRGAGLPRRRRRRRRVLGPTPVPRDDDPRRRRAVGRARPLPASPPTPGSSRDVALDGIDELLTGFFPRPRSRLRAAEPITIAVLPEDAERALAGRRSAARPPVTDAPTRRRGGRRRPARLGGRALPDPVEPQRRGPRRRLRPVGRDAARHLVADRSMTEVLVPAARLERWVENFGTGTASTTLARRATAP